MTGVAPGLVPLVIVGASWGGLHAVSTILRDLPHDLPAAVVIVQHRGREGPELLGTLLHDVTSLAVRDVDDKEPIAASHVYLAPPDYHLLVEQGYFSLATDAVVRYSRPSIDVTLISAAESYGPHVLAVVCTGANDDGARGARRVVDRGGAALVEDPATAEVRTMPDAAVRQLRTAPVERWRVAALAALGPTITAVVGGAGAHGVRFGPAVDGRASDGRGAT